MSELKEYLFVPYSELQEGDELTDVFTLAESYYLKYDADKVIAEKDAEIAKLKEDLHAANKQVENLINSASSIMLFQDKVNGNTCQELRYNKYKRCVAMSQEWRSYATFCGIQSSWYNNRGFGKTAEEYTWKECHAWRCVKRWLELAWKFEEAHDAEV